MSVQPSLTRSRSAKPPEVSSVKFSIRSRCQPGSREAAQSGSVGRLRPDVNGGGRALEDEQLARRGGHVRDDLHGGGAGADDADALVGQSVQSAVRVPTGVRVVPAAGVEGSARLKALDAGDARELGAVQGTVAHDEELRRHAVAPVGADGPAPAGLVPLDRGDLGGEAGALVQVEVPGDATAVLQDLRGPDVLLARDVGGLFEQREVDVGLDVALGARVPVPVPGAAEVAALLNDAKVVDARLP